MLTVVRIIGVLFPHKTEEVFIPKRKDKKKEKIKEKKEKDKKTKKKRCWGEERFSLLESGVLLEEEDIDMVGALLLKQLNYMVKNIT